MLTEDRERIVPVMKKAHDALEDLRQMTGEGGIGYLGTPADIRASAAIGAALAELLYVQMRRLEID